MNTTTLGNSAHAQTEQLIKINTARRIPISEIIKQQNQERGLELILLP